MPSFKHRQAQSAKEKTKGKQKQAETEIEQFKEECSKCANKMGILEEDRSISGHQWKLSNVSLACISLSAK